MKYRGREDDREGQSTTWEEYNQGSTTGVKPGADIWWGGVFCFLAWN